MARCRTKRILRMPCPICEQMLDVEVEDMPFGITADELLDALDLAQWDELHAACERDARTATIDETHRARRLASIA